MKKINLNFLLLLINMSSANSTTFSDDPEGYTHQNCMFHGNIYRTIEIGQGDVDFPALMTLLNRVNQGVQFIPEVWQGHKNGGEGFWGALEFLESINK